MTTTLARKWMLVLEILQLTACGRLVDDLQLDRAARGRNVILITWDGVRGSEFFNGTDPLLAGSDRAPILPFFWSELAPRGHVFGGPGRLDVMMASNPSFVSLPSYETIMTGQPVACRNNDCSRVTHETVLEYARRELSLDRDKVAAITSWEKISRAVESKPGEIFVNAGLEPMADGSHETDLQSLNQQQNDDRPPWPAARWDRYTFRQALGYLKRHKPKLLFMGFNDSDEWGHRADYGRYIESIRQFDRWLAELIRVLRESGDYGRNTCLVITTDHGRGTGADWPHHHGSLRSAAFVWMYVGCLSSGKLTLKPMIRTQLTSHLDIRPIIEGLLNLGPLPSRLSAAFSNLRMPGQPHFDVLFRRLPPSTFL